MAHVVSFLGCVGSSRMGERTGCETSGSDREYDPLSMRTLGYAVVGAVIVGAIGFLIGFFGPMFLTPQSNQGPLFGIFISGPAGVILGFIGGLIYGIIKGRTPK